MTFRSLGAALTSVVLGVCLAGCPGQQTDNQLTQHLTIQAIQSGGGFVGFTGTSFSQGIPAGKQVHLLSAKVASSSGEFSWMTSLVGTPTLSDAPVLVQKASFAGAASPTDLDVAYTGDLRQFYPDQDVRVYWVLQFAGAQAQSYPDGVTLTFTYELEIK